MSTSLKSQYARWGGLIAQKYWQGGRAAGSCLRKGLSALVIIYVLKIGGHRTKPFAVKKINNKNKQIIALGYYFINVI